MAGGDPPVVFLGMDDNCPKNLHRPPDQKKSQGRELVLGVVECQIKNSDSCDYRVAFGRGYFCTHPDRDLILAKMPIGDN